MDLPLGKGAYNRSTAQQPNVRLENRYFEADPTNRKDATSLMSRPGNDVLAGFGSGPIRNIWYQDGTLDGDLFVVSGNTLFSYSQAGVKTAIVGNIDNSPSKAQMDGTATNLFIADGTQLQYYNGVGSFAEGTVTFSGNPTDADTITTGAFTYVFVNTIGAANTVLIGATVEDTIDNLYAAINLGEGEGTVYGTGTPTNTAVQAFQSDATTLTVRAVDPGTAGNSIATTEASSQLAWAAATLENGQANALVGIPTPDDVAIVSLGVIGGFVLCVAAESQRVYFIRPTPNENEVPSIDPLDFFEAESLPDQIISVIIVGDEIWFLGVDSTEVWYLSGVGTIPFDRIRGRAFSIGVLEGTEVIVNNRVYVVGTDNVVYDATAGLQRISTHGVEEQVRLAREIEGAA